MDDIVGVWSDLGDAVREPPRFLIEGVLPCGIVFVAGPPKSKKTTLEMALALLVAGYKNVQVLPPEMSNATETGRVLILSAEHTGGELRDMVESGMGVPVLNDKSILIADDPWRWRLDDPDALSVLLAWLDDLKPRLFVLDPLVDFHSLEEKDNGEMNRLLRPIQRWAKQNDACFMVIHHTSKKKSDDKTTYKASEMRGGGSLFGIADGVIMLTPQDEDIIVMEGTLKRGAPFKRAVKMGVWGAKPSAEEASASLTELVFNAIKDGAQNYDVIAKGLKVSKTKVVLAVKQLKEDRRLRHDGRRFIVRD